MLRDVSHGCRQDALRSPTLRGYSVAYREDAVNFCPGCGRSHWYIGRLLAECGFCGTAVPLQAANVQAAAGGHSRNRKLYMPSSFAA
jgi:hypothetical protein